MSVWPEERLNERIHNAGAPVTSSVPELLSAFGVRRFTPRACRNIERALAEVGLETRPPLPAAGPSGDVEIATRAEGPAPVSPAPVPAPVGEEARPAPDAWTVFLEGISTRLDALATA